jgi:hypothetical protein
MAVQASDRWWTPYHSFTLQHWKMARLAVGSDGYTVARDDRQAAFHTGTGSTSSLSSMGERASLQYYHA